LQRKVVGKFVTYYVQKRFVENSVVYEIKCKNVVQPDGPQITNNIIRRMRLAFWITNIAFTQNMQYALFLHGNNGYANGPPCYVTHTLPVLNSTVRGSIVWNANNDI
jgi:hypothetical protein